MQPQSEIALGDRVQMKRAHPCGSDMFTVIRVGMDIKLRCSGCPRIVMLDREQFFKRLKKVCVKSNGQDA